MRIAALSDFHIGASARADQFRHAERDFHGFLDELEARHDHIVLVGDIYQTEHGPNLSRRTAARELAVARARLPALTRRFESGGYTYLHGNHDDIARDEVGARTSVRFEADGFSVYFVHGHQYDPLFNRLYPLARLSTWMSGRLRSAGLRALPDYLEHKDIALKHERFKGADGPYAAAARDLFRTHDADAVVMGHTHVPLRLDLGRGVLANTGTCSMGLRMHVSVDTSTRTVELNAG